MLAAVTHKHIVANRDSLLNCLFNCVDRVCGFIDFFAANATHNKSEVSVVEHSAYDHVGQVSYI